MVFLAVGFSFSSGLMELELELELEMTSTWRNASCCFIWF
jgi:hypothetical protein